SATDKIALSYLAVDANGKIKGGNTDSLSMTNLRPETKTRIEQSGIRILNRLDLPAGRYQLRVGAHDSAGGNVGSVLYDLEVPDYQKSPFSVSGVVLTSAATAALPTVRPDEQLRAVLPMPPVAMRTFPGNDEIHVFAEVYDNQGATPHKVDITATIVTDEGKVLFKNDETRDSSDLGGKSGGYGYTATIPLKDIPAGRYVLRVEGKSRLGNTPAASRDVRIEIGPPR